MSNIQEMFQEKFNQMIEQKEIRRKTDINEMALNYFKLTFRYIRNGDNCPFPHYLVKNYYNSQKLRLC